MLFPLCCSRVWIGSCGNLLTQTSVFVFVFPPAAAPDMDEVDNSNGLEVRYVLLLFVGLNYFPVSVSRS